MRAVAASLGLLALCACETVPDVVVEPPHCPGAAVAAVESEPVGPALTPEQLAALDAAVISAVGFDLGLAFTRHREVEHPAWGRRLAQRVEAVKRWCEER